MATELLPAKLVQKPSNDEAINVSDASSLRTATARIKRVKGNFSSNAQAESTTNEITFEFTIYESDDDDSGDNNGDDSSYNETMVTAATMTTTTTTTTKTPKKFYVDFRVAGANVRLEVDDESVDPGNRETKMRKLNFHL